MPRSRRISATRSARAASPAVVREMKTRDLRVDAICRIFFLPVYRHSLRIFQLYFSSPVAVLLDKTTGFGEFGVVVDVGELAFAFVLRQSAKESRAMQMHVGEVERHRAALGDLLRFLQQPFGFLQVLAQGAVVERGGEEGVGEFVARVAIAKSCYHPFRHLSDFVLIFWAATTFGD